MGALRAALRQDREAKGKASDRLTADIYRFGQYASARALRRPLFWVYRAVDTVWTRIVVGAEIPHTVQAGPGFVVRHWGRGIIIHPDVKIGANAHIYHRVTIGIGSDGAVPTLGDDVYVGAGATIIGGIHIGDGAKIGAGAVVVKDVPAGATVVSAPPRVIVDLVGGSSDLVPIRPVRPETEDVVGRRGEVAV